MVRSHLQLIKCLLLVLVASGLMVGCVSDQISPKVIVPDSVSFASDIVPIFEASCNQQGCHGANSVPPNLTAEDAWVSLIFFNYIDTVNSEESELWQKISGGSMDEYATDQDRALILKWIDQDAPDN